MMEAIANLVRAFPAERARHGQPFVALRAAPRPGPSGALEWSLGVRCEPRSAVALDAAISAAYPDVRLGRRHGEPPATRAPASSRVPGHVHALPQGSAASSTRSLAAGDELASPPLEAIAHAQVAARRAVGRPLPAHPRAGRASRRSRAAVYRRHENRLVAPGALGTARGRPAPRRSTAPRWPTPSAPRTAACSGSRLVDRRRRRARPASSSPPPSRPAAARTACTAAGCSSATNLYRRRFAAATPPLLPSPRALVSAAEAAHLLALPTARMKGVPVRRARRPAHPDAARDPCAPTADAPIAAPTRRPRRRARARAHERRATAGAGAAAHRPLPYPLLPVLRAEQRRRPDPPRRPQVRHAARRRPGLAARPPRCCAPTSTTSATTTPPSSSSTPRASSAASASRSPRPTAPSASGSSTSATPPSA